MCCVNAISFYVFVLYCNFKCFVSFMLVVFVVCVIVFSFLEPHPWVHRLSSEHIFVGGGHQGGAEYRNQGGGLQVGPNIEIKTVGRRRG